MIDVTTLQYLAALITGFFYCEYIVINTKGGVKPLPFNKDVLIKYLYPVWVVLLTITVYEYSYSWWSYIKVRVVEYMVAYFVAFYTNYFMDDIFHLLKALVNEGPIKDILSVFYKYRMATTYRIWLLTLLITTYAYMQDSEVNLPELTLPVWVFGGLLGAIRSTMLTIDSSKAFSRGSNYVRMLMDIYDYLKYGIGKNNK